MNETLQQFCHRILPIVQAGAEGKDIESKCLRDADDWGSHEARLFLHDYEYRVAQPKATPLPITPEMWAMIDLRYEWAVLGSKDIVNFCVTEPEWTGSEWRAECTYGFPCQSPLAIDTTKIIPELSLTKRPDAQKIVVDGDCDVHGTKVHIKEKLMIDHVLETVDKMKVIMGRVGVNYPDLTPIFVNGVRVGSLNQFGEVTGGSGYDPESTRKEMDRLAE